MIDLTNYRELQEPMETKTILTCYVRLDKKTMLDALKAESIRIDGKYYKVPEHTLLECLINKRFGDIMLELEQI